MCTHAGDFMIREKTILCKLNQIKISDEQLFYSLVPSYEVCPHCGARNCFTPHGSYKRTMIGLLNHSRIEKTLIIKRVMCSSCKKTHALLSDILIPFGSYSIRFILLVLKAYLTSSKTIVALCDSFQIAASTLYKWIHLFKEHANLLLTSLSQHTWISETSLTYLEDIKALPSFFFSRYRFSFLQDHIRRIAPPLYD